MNSIGFANLTLILIGVALTLSGPTILYKTVVGVIKRRQEDPKADLQLASNALNVIIAVLFFMAGILFIVNNLRGNPLS